MTDKVEHIKSLLAGCTDEQQKAVLSYLRERIAIHPLEDELGTPVEIIMEALSRAGDLTMRGIRGVVAQAAFDQYVIQRLIGWQSHPLQGDPPYDFKLADHHGIVRVQVKLQRSLAKRPMLANEAKRSLPADMFVVETQRTRSGKARDGRATRPYRVGEFDILAVSMHPATKNWENFMYTVAAWLLPRADGESLQVFQPVPQEPNQDWTDSFEQSVAWLRTGIIKTISSRGAAEQPY